MYHHFNIEYHCSHRIFTYSHILSNENTQSYRQCDSQSHCYFPHAFTASQSVENGMEKFVFYSQSRFNCFISLAFFTEFRKS